jgi:hypothetical protein
VLAHRRGRGVDRVVGEQSGLGERDEPREAVEIGIDLDGAPGEADPR